MDKAERFRNSGMRRRGGRTNNMSREVGKGRTSVVVVVVLVGRGGGGFRYVITNILYKDQVRHIKSRGMWPSDPLFADDVDNDRGSTTAASGGTRRGRSDRGVGGVATEETVDDDCRPNDDDGDDYGYESPSDDRDGA